MKTTVEQRLVLVLAEGEVPGAVSNAKGHLFEQFVARLFELHGYEKPTVEQLNVTQQGVELDLRTKHALNKNTAIAECKAYSSNLSVHDLSAFYGKLTTTRFDDPDVVGFFVAVPGLTAEGNETKAQIEKKDKRFHAISTSEIFGLLQKAGEIVPTEVAAATLGLNGSLLSHEALLVTAIGLFVAAKEADPNTQLARRVLVFPKAGTGVSKTVLQLLSSTPYAAGLDCVSAEAAIVSHGVAPAPAVPETAIVEVKGSHEDFEYHLPASPPFFVGREDQVSELVAILEAVTVHDAESQVFVLNAQSGWGKSSLALKIAQLSVDRGGIGICIDCRTAVHPGFVLASMRLFLSRAVSKKLLALPSDTSYTGIPPLMASLSKTTVNNPAPLCIVFDQFENVFRLRAVAREFRDLALALAKVRIPIALGFAWKTDLVAFTEGYPYELRDDIRSGARVVALKPLSAKDVGQLLKRLQKKAPQKIHRDLAERLREYSQGLPWLFKKLAAHILKELASGATQDQLLSEALNVERLFDGDLAGLTPDERSILTKIAKNSPMLMTDALDLAGKPDVIQTLLHQRLLVAVGERVDVYWDIFRDYLVFGTVPLKESYILRLTPNAGARLLQLLQKEGPLSPEEAAERLSTSVISVFNMARDLRQVGILAVSPGVLQLAPSIEQASEDPNAAARARAAASLKRHRALDLLNELAGGNGIVSLGAFSIALPTMYPAVTAKPGTWENYGSALAHWFEFAGLVSIAKDQIMINPGKTPFGDIFAHRRRIRRGAMVFPNANVGPVLRLLDRLHQDGSLLASEAQSRKAVVQGLQLGLVDEDTNTKKVSLTEMGAVLAATTGKQRESTLKEILESIPEIASAMTAYAQNRSIGAADLVKGVTQVASLKSGTQEWIGKLLRGWFRAAGI